MSLMLADTEARVSDVNVSRETQKPVSLMLAGREILLGSGGNVLKEVWQSVIWLVSWCFEPSQPQKVWQKTCGMMFVV